MENRLQDRLLNKAIKLQNSMSMNTVGIKKVGVGQTCMNWLHRQRKLGQIHGDPRDASCPGKRQLEARTVLGEAFSSVDTLSSTF